VLAGGYYKMDQNAKGVLMAKQADKAGDKDATTSCAAIAPPAAVVPPTAKPQKQPCAAIVISRGACFKGFIFHLPEVSRETVEPPCAEGCFSAAFATRAEVVN
jgi:hypothetical protein